MKTFRPYQPNQTLLLPPSLGDWLPKDHLAYFLSEVVDQLDLSKIYGAYQEERGYPPYDPRMMVKIWVYAYAKGIRSSRRIAAALYEDVAFRVLADNQQPSFSTIALFRRRHHEALGELLVQTVRLAQKAGLVQLKQVAVDGTKVKANASKHSSMSYGRMQEEEKRLEAEIEQYLKEAETVDAEEDAAFGDRRGDELPPELADRQKRLEAIRRAKAELEEEARRKAEEQRVKEPANRRDKDDPPPKPKAKAQRNFADPDSRIMRNAEKAFIQGYNAQLVVDVKSQIILASDLTNQAADVGHLVPLIDQVEVNTGQAPKQVLADAGYYSDANRAALEQRGIDALIPPYKVRHTVWREARYPRGRIPRNLSAKDRMWRKVMSKRGRETYKLRHTSVEPVIGQIKWARNLLQFTVRGLAKVRSLWRFDCAVHNLLKLYRLGYQPQG
ncbi:MAG: IS1182 family transposase [Limnochordales bacterium]